MKKNMMAVLVLTLALMFACSAPQPSGTRIELKSDGWTIVGNLEMPASDQPVPAVLLLHMMPTDRTSYNHLAGLLAERGIASLRIDLRGHGESTNLGTHNREINAQAWRDVMAAVSFLQGHEGIDPRRIGVLGASYSGEQAVHAGREGAEIRAYVIMSSGSFSEESIAFVADSEAPWLFIAAQGDANPKVPELMQRASDARDGSDLMLYEAGGHGTFLFAVYSDLEEEIADWFAGHLIE